MTEANELLAWSDRSDERWHGRSWVVERNRGGELVTLAWRQNLGHEIRVGSFRHLGRSDALALAHALLDAARADEGEPAP